MLNLNQQNFIQILQNFILLKVILNKKIERIFAYKIFCQYQNGDFDKNLAQIKQSYCLRDCLCNDLTSPQRTVYTAVVYKPLFI